MELIDCIPVGKKNAVSRATLCGLTGMTDRTLRENIALLRRDTPIINGQDGGGYYRPDDDDIDAVRRSVAQETRRARSVFWALHGARKWLEAHR